MGQVGSLDSKLSQTRGVVITSGLSSTEGVLSFLVIAASMLLIIGGVLGAKFYMIEDRTLLGLESWTIRSWFDWVMSDASDVQRFRPIYLAYIALGANWFGRSPLIWHFITLLWGVISLFLFYNTARRLGAKVLAAALFVGVLAFSGNQAWTWINLIPQETLGVLFTSIAIWAFSVAMSGHRKRWWDTVGVVALVLAGLTKESFVLVIPATLLFRLALERRASGETWSQCFVSLWAPLVAGLVLFALLLTAMSAIMLSNPHGFSATATGLSLASFRPNRWVELLSTLGLNLPLLLAALLLVIHGVRKPQAREPLVAATIIAVAWLAPQFVLYTKGMDGRYAFPAMIAVAGIMALGISAVPRGLLFVSQLAFGFLLLPIVVEGSLFANRSANWLVAETVSVDRMVKFIAQNVPRTQAVVIAGDPGTGYGLEALYYSLPIYIRLAADNSPIPIYAWPLVSKGPRDAAQAASHGGGTLMVNPLTLNPADVGAIILVDSFTTGLHAEPLVDWFADSEWSELSFNETYRYFSVNGQHFANSDEVNHHLLVPRKALPENPIIAIDKSAISRIAAGPFVDGPPWGLEKDYAGAGMVAWLGHGDEQGMGGTLIAAVAGKASIAVEVVQGPSRAGQIRTAELAIGSGAEQRVIQKTFDGGVWNFEVELQQGANPFRLRVLDAPTVAELPNGDKRTLLALVRRIMVRG